MRPQPSMPANHFSNVVPDFIGFGRRRLLLRSQISIYQDFLPLLARQTARHLGGATLLAPSYIDDIHS